jgi:hypothetical protein
MMSRLGVLLLTLALLPAAPGYAAAEDARFVGDVVAKWLPQSPRMELTEPVTYVDAAGIRWTAPKGSVIDGAFIPRPLWNIVGTPFTGAYRKASVIHEFSCRNMSRPWQEVHHVLLQAALAEGNDAFHSKLLYGAVYAWGPRWEMRGGKPVPTPGPAEPPTAKDLQELSAWIKENNPERETIANYVQTRFPRFPPLTGKRVALVIGNAQYQFTTELRNPKHDAEDLGEVFAQLGYQVIRGFDLDRGGMERALRAFSIALRDSDVGLFFYAGHGIQSSNRNYLLPVDARIADASSLDFEAVALDLVQKTMERQTGTNIIFLDACRDNPLARNLAKTMGTRSAEIGRGLARVESGVGTLIAFSTQPENVALDGAGRNSPFAQSLIARIKSQAPKDDLSTILIDVRNDVMIATHDKQVPWDHSNLRARFFFGSPPPVITVATSGQAEIKVGASQPKSERLIVKHRPDGSAQYKLSEIASLENRLPTKEECNDLGKGHGAQLRDEGGASVRCWVRIGPGDLGYCQPGRQRWIVEHYNRDFLDGLVILLHP